MRRDFFSFEPTHKLTISGNHAPMISVGDHAMKRRIRVVPFDKQPPERDEKLNGTLLEEAPQILNWAIEGCFEWQKHGLPVPSVVAAATNGYFEMENLFDDWLRECCEMKAEAWEPTKELLDSWNTYRGDRGERVESHRQLVERLRRRGLEAGSNAERATVNGERRRVVCGICLRNR